MPAKSKAQQKFMGIVHGLQKGTVKPSTVSGKAKKVAKSMKKKSAKDFASTKHKGLPKKVKSESVNEVSFSSVPTKKLVKQYKQMADEKLSGSAALTFRMIAKELIKRKAKLESVNEADEITLKKKMAKEMDMVDKHREAVKKHSGVDKDKADRALARMKAAQQRADKIQDKIIGIKREVEEGFGGELKGRARQEFEKARQENAEVLGYELTGTKDIKEYHKFRGYYKKKKKPVKKEDITMLEAKFTDDTLASRIKHWSKQHKGTGIGYGHVLGQLAVHMKEMGWSKSFKEVARVAVELGKKKTVESVTEAGRSVQDPARFTAIFDKLLRKQMGKDYKKKIPSKKDFERVFGLMRKRYGELESVDEKMGPEQYHKYLQYVFDTQFKTPEEKKMKKSMIKKINVSQKKKGLPVFKESVNEGDKRQYRDVYYKYYKTYEAFAREVMNLAKSVSKISGDKTDERVILKNFKKQVIPFAGLMRSWSRGREKNPHISESDLGLTLKKGKTVKVTHKSSGKELIVIDKPNVRKEYEKIGFYVEGKVNEVSGVDVAKKVLKNKQMEKGIDLQTANLIVTIDKAYNKNPELQKKFRKIQLPKMKQLIMKYYG